jgi:hypothetical protein
MTVRNKQTKTDYSIELRLSQLSYYRGSRQGPRSKDIQLFCENICQLLFLHHSCLFYSITIRLVPEEGRSASEEWLAFSQLLPDVFSSLQKQLLIAGFVAGTEMSQKDARAGRSSKLAGRPHIHIFLAAYNDFLNPSRFEIRFAFTQLRLDVQVNALPCHNDFLLQKNVCSALRYVLKGHNDSILQEACGHYLKSSSIWVFSNTRLQNNPFQAFSEGLKLRGFKHRFVSAGAGALVPSVRRYEDLVAGVRLQIAEFVRAICLQEGLAFHSDRLYRVVSPSRYTWTAWRSASDFGSQVLGSLHLPTSYLTKYHQSAAWVLTEGEVKKLGPTVCVFPRLTFQRHLWEFNDGVYDLLAGKWGVDFPPFTSCSMHHRYNFDELPFPTNLLIFLQELTVPRSDVRELLVRLGSLFHETSDRKQDPALWLSGSNNSFKSWFVLNFLKTNFSEALILTLDRQKGAFRYAALLHAENSRVSGVVYSDDFRSSNFVDEAGTLLNLLDGQPVVTQEKYTASQKVHFHHGFIVTSNERLSDTAWLEIDRLALAKRFREICFEQPSEKEKAFLESLLLEFAGLGFLANFLYLECLGQKEIVLPKSWASFTKEGLLFEANSLPRKESGAIPKEKALLLTFDPLPPKWGCFSKQPSSFDSDNFDD